ncbi:MAG: LCP family protein [Nocardioides sp.]|nr:LCP family protein [Nocardioides sp.]
MKHAGRRSAATPTSPTSARRRGTRRNKPVARHTIAKVLISSLLALGLVTGLGVAYLYDHFNGNLNIISVDGQLSNRPTAKTFEGPRSPINILVMGSDTREGEGNDIDSEGGGGSDTTILMHLSADRRSAYGISVPRDTLVDRPECTALNGDTIPAQDGVLWNEAYNVGGAACTIQQFEQLTGVLVDNYVVVDFTGFKSMVDAVGGVEICVPEEIDDAKTGLTLQPGTQTIKGDDALNYVRLRYSIGDGSDIGRIKRQQAFVAAMASKVVSGGVLGRPDRLLNFVGAVTKSLTTDLGNLLDIAQVGGQFQGVGLKRIQFVTVPFEYSTEDPGRVVMTAEADALWDKVINDAPLGKLRAGSISAGAVPGAEPSGSASTGPGPSGSPSSSPTDDVTEEPGDGATTSPSAEAEAEDLASVGLCT